MALEALRHKAYDLVIIDMHMRVMGGLEAYKSYSTSILKDELVP